MPFLRQAHGIKLRRIPNNVALHPSTVRLASLSSKHKKDHVARDLQAKARPDHNEARYGKRQKAFWKSMTPEFLTQETKASSEKSGLFSQASAFRLYASHKSGSEPIVEASSASWDSKTNEVSHTVYDPISGRMVPISAKKEQTRQASTSAKSKKHNHSTDKVYQKPSVISQLADDTEALSNTPKAHASFTEDFDKTYQSEHDELLAARRHLDTLREQIQILERQTHPEMTKPQYAVDAERPAIFEDGWDNNPKGLQTAFKLELEACEHGKAESLEQEMVALNKRPVQEVNDDYSISPSGMETLFANEQKGNDISHQSTLEQELLAMNTVTPPVDDRHSPSPQGLETLFEQEQSGGRSLEDEVRMTGSAPGQPQCIVGFAKEPTGLETAYEREQLGTSTLEHELENMASSPIVSDLNDAYSTKPFGMETLYEREAEGNQKGQHGSLEHELHDHIQTLDKYSSANLDGLQTLWKREQEGVETGRARSLEDEIKASQQPQITPNEYDMSPFGMETHFRDEAQKTEDGKLETLEEEVKRKLQARIQDDGHSHSPSGLETAFRNEEKDAILGNRQTLEKEISSLEPGFEDGYSTMPAGLQMMLHCERESGGRSLEEDLKQMEEASYHEDGYSRAPIGMENSFEREAKDESISLETDLKDMPGEGDLSPTVGKFAARDQWYKQPARSTFSEDFSKTDVKELNQHTAVLGRSLNQVSSNLESSVPSPEATTKTKHEENTAVPVNDSIDSSLPRETSPTIEWAEPALYKVIAHDSSKDIITITTAPSNFSNSEMPISIPQAISKLAQTARFLPYLASAQNEGFQVIHAEGDYLILRKVHIDPQTKTTRYDGDINPVDGTTKYIPIEPASARFASPTGFVNYEPIFPTATIHKHKDATSSSSDIHAKEHPQFKQQTSYSKSPVQVELRGNRYRIVDKFRKERRRRWRRRIVWVLSVAAGTAVCTTYVAGVSGEVARSDQRIPQPRR